MKILMLCYEYPPLGGGGARVVDGLTKGLIRKGHRVDLVTMGYKGLPNFEKKENLNIYRTSWKRSDPSICTPLEMIPYLISAFFLIKKLCKIENYHINHTHFIFPDGILARLTKIVTNLPYIITAHGSDVPGYNPDRFKILHFFLRPIWKKVIKNASNVIFPSLYLKKLADKVQPSIPSKIIPNGFDPAMFSPNRPKKNQILVVTRMFERKGVQFFLQALKGMEMNFSPL